MVGGIVTEVCDDPRDKSRVYIGVIDKNKEGGIFVKRTKHSDQIQIGDTLWWSGMWALWTPQDNVATYKEAQRRRLKTGIDYEIQIPKIGYTAKHPSTCVEK